MKKFILGILFLFNCINVQAAVITHGGTLPDSSQKSDFYALIDSGTISGIVNADVSSTAAIVGSKLDLSSPGTIGNTVANTGKFTTLSATGLLTTTNNVGIGSTLPGSLLDVNGTVGARFLGSGNTIINNGNVGIGSLTPGQMLDIQGTVRALGIIAQPIYIKVTNSQSSGTGGGTATSGSWIIVPINTKDNDTLSIASVCTANGAPVATCTAANQVVLPAGTYLIRAVTPVYETDNSQTRLQNITASTTLLTGENCYSGSIASYSFGSCHLNGTFTLSVISALAIQYQVTTSKNTVGLGPASSFGTEVYTIAEFIKVS